jgi:hypothetical protein
MAATISKRGVLSKLNGDGQALESGEMTGQIAGRSIEHNLSYRTLKRGRNFEASTRRPIMYLMFNWNRTNSRLPQCSKSARNQAKIEPGAKMAGYSGTPLPKKLGIKADHLVAIVNAPNGFQATISPLPDGVAIVDSLPGSGKADVIVLFTTSLSELRAAFKSAAKKLKPAGGLWIGWPKKASGMPTDVSENPVRDIGLAAGLVDNKVCALDETWSGLRFVYRLADRPKKKAKAK